MKDKKYKKLIKKGLIENPLTLTVKGRSMKPFFNEGMKVKIVNDNNYAFGDIAVFLKEGKLVAHRIVWLNGRKVITKGDSNFYFDYKITKEELLGKVVMDKMLFQKLFKYIVVIYSIFIGISYKLYTKVKIDQTLNIL